MSEIVDETVELAAARTGDTEAFAALYRRHRTSALAFATTLVGVVDGPDVVAESFTKILKALRTGSGPQDELRPYLFTTIRSVAIDRSRKPPTAGYEPTDDDLAVPMQNHRAAADHLADQDLLRRIMSRLPDRWRRALWLSEVEGKPARALAKELGVSANSAAAVLYRAKEGLRTAYLAEWLAQQPESDHAEILDELPSFVRDSLSRRARDRVTEHLQTCGTCTALVTELRLVNTNLSAQSSLVYLTVVAVPALGTLGGATGFGLFGASSAVAVKVAAGAAAVAVTATALFLVLRPPAPVGAEQPAPTPVATRSALSITPGPSSDEPVTVAPSSTPSPTPIAPSTTPSSVPAPATTPSPPPIAEPTPEPPAPAPVEPEAAPPVEPEPAPEPVTPVFTPEPEPLPVDTCAATIEGPNGQQCLGLEPAPADPAPVDPAATAEPAPGTDPPPGAVPLFSVGP